MGACERKVHGSFAFLIYIFTKFTYSLMKILLILKGEKSMKMDRTEKIIAGTMYLSGIGCLCGMCWTAVHYGQYSLVEGVVTAVVSCLVATIGCGLIMLRK